MKEVVNFVKRGSLTFVKVKEDQKPDSLVADNYELLKDSNENNNGTADYISLYLAKTRPKTDDVTSPQESGK